MTCVFDALMFRSRCGGGVKIRGGVKVRQSGRDFNKGGNILSGGSNASTSIVPLQALIRRFIFYI